MYRKYFYILFVVFYAIARLSAADIQMSATVDRNTIALGEVLTLQVSVSGDTTSIPNPVIPSMPDMSITSSGKSQNISFVNGKVTSSITFNYVLMPKSLGKHTIQPIAINVGGTMHQTAPIRIEVVKSPASSSAAQGGGTTRQPPAVQKEHLSPSDSSQDVFVKAELDKNKAYVGEMVAYTFRFYRRIRLIGDAQFAPPELVGFIKEDLPPQKNYYADINGSRYMVSEIKIALFPTAPGSYVIKPAQLNVTVPVATRDPFFDDDFFGSLFTGRGRTQLLKTNTINLQVFSFPEKDTAVGFKGAVGSFTITSDVDKKEGTVGEPITWSVAISGTGNIKSVTEPVWGNLKGFKKYDTVSSLSSNVQNYRITGSKVFQTVIVPEISGTLTVPSATFVFFDPSVQKYKTVQSSLITLSVKPGDKKEYSAVANPSGTGIKTLEQDIRFIKTSQMKRASAGRPYILQAKYWGFVLLLFCAVLGSWGFETYRIRTVQDIVWTRSRTAHRSARKQLAHAVRSLKKGSDKEFFAAISDAIRGFFADKMNISAKGLTIRDIAEQLEQRGFQEEVIQKTRDILEQSDMGRFTFSSVAREEKNVLLKETENVLSVLVKNFRK